MLPWVVLDQRQSVPSCRAHRSFLRAGITTLLLAATACATTPPPVQNPLIGTWADTDNDTITLRRDTVVQNRPDGQRTALDNSTCGGAFSFAYATWSSQALTGLLPASLA